ncbi:MAG: 2,3,4,5-tetrahydropyridine-2,6-dicarboxylate N-succinyltransferase [Micrococcaceae bacterium]
MENSLQTTTVYGAGIARIVSDGTVLDVWYPSPSFNTQDITTKDLEHIANNYQDPAHRITKKVITCSAKLDEPPQNTEDAYLRLHALSHRLVTPNTINLDGIFGLLPNNVWTNFGPYPVENFETTRASLNSNGNITVYSIDKFPRMVDYVIPEGVRIADADRVRLGAYLASGTTVMHEGFINFNAGTLGTCMVEGRISAGVTVDDGSDIGGGASVMGTLSGGGKEKISIGKNSLLGANSGVGISLGNDCIVEAGLYITSGTKVTYLKNGESKIVKAADLSGESNILFMRNSQTGTVEARYRASNNVSLNEDLHSN